MPNDTVTRTLRLRLKDKHAKLLTELSREVNFVWNYVNELSVKAFERKREFLSAYDIHAYTAGATKAGLRLHSQTVQAINEEYVRRRKQFKKVKLRWRASGGSRRVLGWIPFKASALRYRNGQLFMAGFDKPLSLWDSYGLSQYKLGPGSFSEDARGRWYLNVTVKIPKKERSLGTKVEGFDLGLASLRTSSDGETRDAARHYRQLEAKLAVAQRSKNLKRVRAIHAKIRNRRHDEHHKDSTALVRTHGALFVGKESLDFLTQSRNAKSAYDAAWASFTAMLRYKCETAGVWFEEVSEEYTTQDCNVCGSRCGPKGLEGLSVREWTCSTCGTQHERDVNAARNIKKRGLAKVAKAFAAASSPAVTEGTLVPGPGHGPLVEGIPSL